VVAAIAGAVDPEAAARGLRTRIDLALAAKNISAE
jgi:hypothetical protein